jgi:hypothetical protein
VGPPRGPSPLPPSCLPNKHLKKEASDRCLSAVTTRVTGLLALPLSLKTRISNFRV